MPLMQLEEDLNTPFVTVPITSKGQLVGFAMVDRKDYRWACQYRWSLNGSGYPTSKIGGMHRHVAQAKKGQDVDHINHNKFDNRSANLRLGSHSQNCSNRRTSTGVTFHKMRQKWMAQICSRGVHMYLGLFANKDEALAVRRAAEKKYFGAFAPVRA